MPWLAQICALKTTMAHNKYLDVIYAAFNIAPNQHGVAGGLTFYSVSQMHKQSHKHCCFERRRQTVSITRVEMGQVAYAIPAPDDHASPILLISVANLVFRLVDVGAVAFAIGVRSSGA